MTRRAMTLLELLVSLGLLSMVVVGVVSWTTVTLRSGLEATTPGRRLMTVAAVHQVMCEDLLIGDRGSTSGPPVQVSDNVLTVRTRATDLDQRPGPVHHRYVFEASTGRLLREHEASGSRGRRVLLEGVSEWAVQLDERGKSLSVTIELDGGVVATRSFRWR